MSTQNRNRNIECEYGTMLRRKFRQGKGSDHSKHTHKITSFWSQCVISHKHRKQKQGLRKSTEMLRNLFKNVIIVICHS